MLKRVFLICSFFIFASCNNEQKHEKEKRIIYELDQKYSSFIIDHFEKRFNEESGFLDKFDFKEQYVNIRNTKSDIGDSRIAFYTNTDARCYRQLVSKTNRFLKLSDSYIIPIVFSEDAVYSKNQEKCLSSALGGGKIFYIDTYNKTITWVTEM